MAIRFTAIVQHTKQILLTRYVNSHRSSSLDVPKGHFAVYVGGSQNNRFVVPISYLSHPLFQDLLRRAEEEYGFDHPTAPLTIPCSKDTFLTVTSHLSDYGRSCNYI